MLVVVRALLVIFLVGGLASVDGCGTDPVKIDLETYHSQVLVPVAEEEHKTVAEMESLPAQLAAKKKSPEEIQALYEATLLPRYKTILERTERFAAKTPEVRALNQKLAELYQRSVEHLQACVAAIKAKDVKRFEEAHKAMAELKFDPFKTELQALAGRHGARLAGPPPSAASPAAR